MTKATASYTTTQSTTTISVYRAGPGLISSTINAVLPRTNDTGQVNFATLTTTTTSITRDYELFQFTDTLQQTKPIIIRLAYSTNQIALAVGVGSNGSGAITGSTSPGVDFNPFHNIASIGNTRYVYASSDGSYFTLAMNMQSSAATTADSIAGIVVERTRDADGTPNGDGIMLWRWGVNSTDAGAAATTLNIFNVYGRTYDQTSNALQPLAGYELYAPIPNMVNTTSFTTGPNSSAFPVYGNIGPTPYGASKAVMVGAPADFNRLTVYPISHYGTTMQFLSLAGSTPMNIPYMANATTAGARNMAPLIRWE